MVRAQLSRSSGATTKSGSACVSTCFQVSGITMSDYTRCAAVPHVDRRIVGISRGRRRMSIDDNKDLVRRFYREIDAGNIDALDELVAEDYLDHSPPPFPGIGAPGREGLKQAFRLFWE